MAIITAVRFALTRRGGEAIGPEARAADFRFAKEGNRGEESTVVALSRRRNNISASLRAANSLKNVCLEHWKLAMAGQAEMRGDFHIVNEALRSQPFDRVPALAHATSMTCGTAPYPDRFSMLYNGRSDGRGTLALIHVDSVRQQKIQAFRRMSRMRNDDGPADH